MKKKLVLFDLDGTLLNSIYAIANAVNKALEKNNLKTYKVEEYNNFVGNGLRKLVEIIIEKEKYNIDVDNLIKDLLEIYDREYDFNLKEYEGIEKLLGYLDENNIKYAIVTNKDTNLAVKSVKCTNLNKFNFIDIIGLYPDKIHLKKPNPENINMLIEKIGVSKEETVFIGDMIVDKESAINAGIDFIYCNWGFGNFKGEENIDEIYKVNTVEEIILKL